LRKMLMQVRNGIEINLDHLELPTLRKDVLGEHTHAWPHLEHRDVRTGINSVGDTLCHTEVGEEMLS